MKTKRIILLLISLPFLGCQQHIQKEEIDVGQEIAGLHSISEKEAYLESIFSIDQNIRNGERSEILLKYGKNSEELQRFYKKMDSIDRLNLKRVESYLAEFGYPNKDSYSQNATITPWLVIHHSGNLQTRKAYFQILKQAYQNGNLNATQYNLYLARTYHLQYGEYPSWKGTYRPDEKINWLIKKLNLEQ